MKIAIQFLLLSTLLLGCAHQNIFDERPTKRVNLAGWRKLKVGMTKQQVISLLGDAASKTPPGSMTMDKEVISLPELWEYNWQSGLNLFGNPHPKSYAVRFDKDGRLSSWYEPKTTDEQKK